MKQKYSFQYTLCYRCDIESESILDAMLKFAKQTSNFREGKENSLVFIEDDVKIIDSNEQSEKDDVET